MYGRKRWVSTAAVLAAIFMIAFILYSDRISTLLSLKKIDSYPFYIMKYNGGYHFDEYLKRGSNSDSEYYDFLSKRVVGGIKVNNDMGQACTGFYASNENGDMLYCRNLDLTGIHPALLLYTDPPEGYASVSMVELKTLGYFSGNNPCIPEKIFDRKLLLASPYVPRDGMNEWGLAVATLDVPHANAGFDSKKATIGRWQANRLMLDHARNVDEAISLLEKYNLNLGGSGAHFFIGDASGKSAVVEFLNGEMVATYSYKYQVVTNFIMASPDEEGNGHDRYNTAFKSLKETGGAVTEKGAMDILAKVSQPGTAWSCVYNLKTGDIYIAVGRRYDNIIKCKVRTKQCSMKY